MILSYYKRIIDYYQPYYNNLGNYEFICVYLIYVHIRDDSPCVVFVMCVPSMTPNLHIRVFVFCNC